MIAICLHNKDNKASGSYNTMPRLDSDSRNQIIGMLNAGISQREVARRFAVNVSTVLRLNRKFIVTGSIKDCPRSGQPRVTTRPKDNLICLLTLGTGTEQQYQPLQQLFVGITDAFTPELFNIDLKSVVLFVVGLIKVKF